MTIRLFLDTLVSRILAIFALLGISAWLVSLVLSDFLVGALTDDRIAITYDAAPAAFITAPFKDDRIGIDPGVLATALSYLPNSPRLHLRLAEFEAPYGEDDWKVAEYHALRAVQLSPHDYKPLLALASVHEYKGNLKAAEQCLRAALKLAPGNLEVHWRLGTVLLQDARLGESLGEFRIAGAGNPAYLSAALDLVWSASGENAATVAAIDVENASDKLTLAAFLLRNSRAPESAAVFRKVPRIELLAYQKSSEYLNALISAGHVALAHELWRGLVESDDKATKPRANAVWNGGFESDILLDFAQFDWSIRPSNDAQISVDNNTAHSGRRSLRIDFKGRETTRLSDEITQRIQVRPGARYRLGYYVKTHGLVAGEGPRVVLYGSASSEAPNWIARSNPVSESENDWQQQNLEFSPPGAYLTVAIELQPRFSYEDPTYGAVWFDDFEIREID